MIMYEIENNLKHIYSDQNLMIKQVETGIEYDQAWDILSSNYTYEETDKPILPPPENN